MFVTPNDIADRVEMLLTELFPGEPVYRDLAPNGFKRPCNLIVLETCSSNVGFGCNIVELRPVISITTFVEVDEYHHSHLALLHQRQAAITSLFLPGFIRVADRAPHVVSVNTDGGYDFDTAKVTLSYTLDRNEFIKIEQLPEMGQLIIKEEVNT